MVSGKKVFAPAPAAEAKAEAEADAEAAEAAESAEAAAASFDDMAMEIDTEAPLITPAASPLPSPSPLPLESDADFVIQQPLEMGTKAPCRWRDTDIHECEVVDRRLRPGTDTYEYYVHYSGFNRRLDEWVGFERFEYKALVRSERKKVLRKAASERAATANRVKNEKKRRTTTGDKKRKTFSGAAAMSAAKAAAKNDALVAAAAAEKAEPGSAEAIAAEKAEKAAKDRMAALKAGKDPGAINVGSGRAGERIKAREAERLKSEASGAVAAAGGSGATVTREKEKEKVHEETTKLKNIQTIVLHSHAIESWYYSPFPKDYSAYSTLYICGFCLKFMRTKSALDRHAARCPLKHPPGCEIYRKGNISVFEVDGATNRIYCQNLCYIAKLYLDHKTLHYDVDPFWFYIMCEVDDAGAHIVGYFSKEKFSEEDFNVACILTLPPYQRRGFGKFLIAFSYELSKLENRIGSPEKPLSDLGLLGYRSYWAKVLIDLLQKEVDSENAISVHSIMGRTMMKEDDVIGTMQVLDVIQYYEGQHIIDLRKVANMKLGSGGLPCDPSCIKWTPHSIGNGVAGAKKSGAAANVVGQVAR